ncbi:hypothetical protein Bhyg_14333 [Pseudolycoriella hygida]|uniref:Uncharacterized protein n=1 Tax=Pseudolycoriella hygida TaxID=35572 RepID=A0A9Q0MPR1_9DIPT|nr:hypothetical protein Bhyg_14333 [Pseudolycoriella hygida]
MRRCGLHWLHNRWVVISDRALLGSGHVTLLMGNKECESLTKCILLQWKFIVNFHVISRSTTATGYDGLKAIPKNIWSNRKCVPNADSKQMANNLVCEWLHEHPTDDPIDFR